MAARTILVVDDDMDFRAQLRVQLEAAGFAVVEADGLAEARKALAQGRPDLVVVDLMMEHMDDGFVLCHEIKAKDAALPVVMVTAVAAETGIKFDATTDGERAWVKADAILDKPVRFEQLKREIGRLVKG
ncbi:MAG TPA: response regulator [Phycisphaerae bacterium]|nr:response regulator [Phycisphaerae bacterium]HOI55897.1 response regulator [Phycisphaerae bacterium]